MKITAKYLQDTFGDDYNAAIQYAKDQILPYPKRPTKPHLRNNHSPADLKEYNRLFDEWDEMDAEYKKLSAAYSESAGEVHSEIESYLKHIASFYEYVPVEKQAKVWSRAWDNGHSDGYASVFGHLTDLVELFTP